MIRRALLLAPVLLAGCVAQPQVARVFTPVRYDYLLPLRFNVGAIEVGEAPAPGPLDAQSPAPLGEVLRRVGQDRLAAGGSAGRAAYTVEEASITRAGDTLTGRAAVRLEVFGADGARSGFAGASVLRRVAGVGRGAAYQGALYDMSRQMGDDMNVELEYQVRRTLRDYLQDPTTAPPPEPVQQQDLTVPSPAAPGV